MKKIVFLSSDILKGVQSSHMKFSMIGQEKGDLSIQVTV